MNLPKFSVKNQITAQHYVSVKLNKFGDKKPNDYGAETYWGNCHVDGIEHMWFISENMHKQIIEAGFKPGDTFCVLKWKNGPKMGYNYLHAGDIQISNATPMNKQQEQPKDSIPPMPSYMSKNDPIETVKPHVDEFQVRMSRGASYNLAFSLRLKYYERGIEFNSFLVEVAEYAEIIAKHQAKFVQG